MRAVESFLGGAVILIAVYLLLANGNAANAILNSLARMGVGIFGTLQGRDVSGFGDLRVTTPGGARGLGLVR
jgi:hypothetical protein